jgi:predicted ester cyclase
MVFTMNTMNTVRLSRLGTLLILMLSIWGIMSFAAAQDDEVMRTDQEAAHGDLIARVADKVLMTGNFEIIDEFLSEEYVVHSPLGDLDRDGLIAFMLAMRASIPDLTITREILLVEGDYAAVRSVFAGTFDGAEFASPFGVLAPNEADISVYMHSIFLFDEDGRMAEEWVMLDPLNFFTQLGAFPAPDA